MAEGIRDRAGVQVGVSITGIAGPGGGSADWQYCAGEDGLCNLPGRATVRFSDRLDVEPIWQDVRGGIIRNVSVGYAVRAYEIREEEGTVPVWTAVDWQPLELSAVPIGADGAAGFPLVPDFLAHGSGHE